MKSATHLARAITAVTLLCASALAQAGLLGSTVRLDYHVTGFASTSDLLLVGGAVEVSCPLGSFNVCSMLTAPTQTIDFGDTDITYTYTGPNSGFNNVAVNGFDFRDLFLGSSLDGLVLSTNIGGLDLSRISFDAHRVQVDMHGLVLTSPGNYFTLGLQQSAGVPEPGSLALCGLALAGLVVAQRRHR